MGYVNANNVHVDKHLTNLMLNYRPKGMIADMLFPVVPVTHQSDMILEYKQEDLFRIVETGRSPGAEANEAEFGVGSSSYFASNYAMKAKITLEERKNSDPLFLSNLERSRSGFLMDKLTLDWENRIANHVTSATNVGTSSNVSSSWTDYVNSDPYSDINTMMDHIETATGYWPNAIAFGTDAFKSISRNEKIINKN